MTTNNRILIIDDNRAIHDDFRKILAPGNSSIDDAEAEFFGEATPPVIQPTFEIDSAFQGEEGVEVLRRALDEGRPYAVAFVDVRMPPGMDGIETVEALWELYPELQVVICTAHSDYSWHEMVQRLGRRDQLLVLKKPFASVEALQLCCALCEKWSITQQARSRLASIEHIVEQRTHELREANARLEAETVQRQEVENILRRAQRLESIGTLASGIAHDLNNMLSPILMATDLLRPVVPEASQRMIAMIDDSAQRAAWVVKQVLTFARGVEGDRLPLQPKRLICDMQKIIGETFPKQIRCDSKIAPNLALIEGDATQLHQVLLNLCVNARDAMPDGGTLRIEAENFEVDESYASMKPGVRAGSYVHLRVSDTGSGIPREVLDKIFDPFFTTKPLGKGTGLGLSTVLGIVKSHEGFIDVVSEPDKGTTFEIFLPAAIDATAAADREADAASPAGHGELILVVDDENAIRSTTETALTRNGYRTLAAADGAEALSLFARQRTDIAAVFTDVMMPVVDGVALCRALKKIDPDVRIIAATGIAEESRLEELRSLDIDPILNKPFSTGKLLDAINGVLAG